MTQPVDLLFIYSEIINLKLLFMKKLYTLCAALLALLPALTFAAQPEEVLRTVIVSDAAGPIIGASVVVKGTTTGSSTDIDGRTTISCADDAVLSISYIGYASQEVAVLHVRRSKCVWKRMPSGSTRLSWSVTIWYAALK